MPRTEIISTGFHVPEQVVTNEELTEWWDTSDEWIRERTGIEQRYWVQKGSGEVGSDLAVRATEQALDRAGMDASEIDCIVYATLSPDVYFPGGGVFLQQKLGLKGIPALDVRNQCTGFVYGLSVADAWIRTGQYRRVLLVGAEVHSVGLDYGPAGRDVGVLFGDGAGAAILGPTDDDRGVLSTHLFSDGRGAEKLWVEAGGARHYPRLSHEALDAGTHFPIMEGREVFKNAVVRMPQSVQAALEANDLAVDDIDLLIAHQANLRINEMVAKKLGLRDDQVYNNIQRFGNTTAATIPIAMHEAVEQGLLDRGDLLVLTAFGSGFTWASAAIRW